MTIGRFGHDARLGPNPDFQQLMDLFRNICEKCELDSKHLMVSMGMSDDFEHAVRHL